MATRLWDQAERLIVVAGHAVYLGRGDDRDPLSDAAWYLHDFQTGEAPYYAAHIKRGVELAADGNARPLLMFSGGQTRGEIGPRGEAQSYWEAADYCGWWGMGAVAGRATTEEFARDSLENLLYSVCRFYECARRFPRTVTVVGWAFKARRFDLYRRWLRWPETDFTYVGDDDPPRADEARRSEREVVTALARGDSSSSLAKRNARNPFARHHPYETSCPALTEALRHFAVRESPFEGPLPWD